MSESKEFTGDDVVLIDIDDHVADVRLNRPRKINALDENLWFGIERAFLHLRDRTDVRVIVFRGEGDRGFSAGLDLMGLGPMAQTMATGTPAQRVRSMYRHIRRLQAAWRTIETVPQPVIAVVHGYCLGGGVELITHADMRISSPEAVFSLPEVKLGISPDMGGCSRLWRIVGPGWAKRLVFTAEQIDAQTAQRIGLIDEVVPRDQLLVHARELARKIAANSPMGVQAAKRAIQLIALADIDAAEDREATSVADCFASTDVMEGFASQAERRPPMFKGE